MNTDLVDVAVNFPVGKGILSYKADKNYRVGSVVDVPLGKRKSKGVVLRSASSSDGLEWGKIKPILGLDDRYPILSKPELELFCWMAKYYHYSLGKLIFDSLPTMLKRPRKVEPLIGQGLPIEHTMSDDQKTVFGKVDSHLACGFSQHLVHGVTGSGKSLIFLELIKKTVLSGKSAQFLLPEINLTPQFLDLFRRHLPCAIFSYHSGITRSEKYSIYQKLKSLEHPVLVMGVRSSVFLPIDNLGVIVVDEEHDGSFKQEDRCPYSARDVAIKKAQIHNIPVLLSSATPSVEHFYHFKNNTANRHYHGLAKRVGGGKLPQLKFLDLRDRLSYTEPNWPFLPTSLQAIKERLEVGEQVLVFINKLGFANYLQCASCGHQFQNEDCGCGVNLRYFKNKNILSCAHCDFKTPKPSNCPKCGCLTLMQRGFGTEKVQEVLQSFFADKCIERFDRDEIANTRQLNDKLERFHRGSIDVLVGTQMLSKGHNFAQVNLVVILGVDAQLNFADFRSQERVYQLLRQVSGRAGRYRQGAEVLVQTYNPEHPLFCKVVDENIEHFYEKELQMRQLCSCPPFSYLASFFFSSADRTKLINTISAVARELEAIAAKHFPSLQLLGPSPSMIEKKAHQYTWVFMLKTQKREELHQLIETYENNYRAVSGVGVKIDVDPQHTL